MTLRPLQRHPPNAKTITETYEVGMLRQNRGLSTPEIYREVCEDSLVNQKATDEILHSTALRLVSPHVAEF